MAKDLTSRIVQSMVETIYVVPDIMPRYLHHLGLQRTGMVPYMRDGPEGFKVDMDKAGRDGLRASA
jgi:hypothetical protein